MTVLTTDDLAPFADIDRAKAEAMIEHALAQAMSPAVAPCLRTTADPVVISAARSILVGAVLRWHEFGTGSYLSSTAGPPGVATDPRRERDSLLSWREIKNLQALCKSAGGGRRVFSIDLTPGL